MRSAPRPQNAALGAQETMHRRVHAWGVGGLPRHVDVDVGLRFRVEVELIGADQEGFLDALEGAHACSQAVGDAITLVSPENAADIRDIQRFIGAKIPELRLEGFNYAPIIARPDQPTQQRRGQRGGGYGSGGPRHQTGGGPRQHQAGGGRGSSSGGGGRGEGQQRPAEGSWNRFGASGGGGGTGGGRRGR